MMVKHGIFVVSIVFLFNLPPGLPAAVFNVSTVGEIQAAFNTASGNGEDDTVNISAGTYTTTTSTLNYDTEEAQSLTIQSAGGGGYTPGRRSGTDPLHPFHGQLHRCRCYH